MCVGFAPRAIFGAVVGCIGVGGCVVVFGGVGWRLRGELWFGWRLWGGLIGWLCILGLCPKPRFFLEFFKWRDWLSVAGLA